MRSVVVLPQPDGPSMTKNSPSSMVKVEPFTAVKAPKALCEVLDADLGHGSTPEIG